MIADALAMTGFIGGVFGAHLANVGRQISLLTDDIPKLATHAIGFVFEWR